jgi:hypothetical protein
VLVKVRRRWAAFQKNWALISLRAKISHDKWALKARRRTRRPRPGQFGPRTAAERPRERMAGLVRGLEDAKARSRSGALAKKDGCSESDARARRGT